MTDTKHPATEKKVLENNWWNGIAVPLAIVLVGALIVFGVTKMLSTDRSYKDLVHEMQSKSFGNKWVAAYELSKVINSKRIPEEDIPWLVANLGAVYNESPEPRTRNFVIVALGSLRKKEALPYLMKALNDADPEVVFSGVVAIGNLPKGLAISWPSMIELLKRDDAGLVQAVALAIGSHVPSEGQDGLVELLSNSNVNLKYAGATALVAYQAEEAVPLLLEILEGRVTGFTGAKLEALRLNVLNALKRKPWSIFDDTLKKLADSDENLRVRAIAKELLL